MQDPKTQSLFATIDIIVYIDKTVLNNVQGYGILITFKDDFTALELKKRGIKLPYYTKKGTYGWFFKMGSFQQIKPEMLRLKEENFIIENDINKSQISNFLAELI